MKIKNSVVLITGANRGIGRAFVEEILQAGASKIYLGIRQLENVIGLIAHDPKRLVPIRLDVTDQSHIKNAAKKAEDVTILINNAGVLQGGNLFDEQCLKNARQEMEVNYFGPLAMINAFAPVIEKNGGGSIVNVCSVAGLVAMPGMPTYCISKAAEHFLTLEARMELRDQNIQVLGVYPGPVDTDMVRSLDMQKISPNLVARETIHAIESGESHIFPDPCLKNIYAVLQKGSECVWKKETENVLEKAVRAA